MRRRRVGGRAAIVAFSVAALVLYSSHAAATDAESSDEQLAASLAELLRAARGVISAKQDLINNPAIGDKGLTGKVVLEEALQRYQKATGQDLSHLDEATRYGHAMSVLKQSIVEVADENQATINTPNVGFKGFIPAVFARLVNEHFDEMMKGKAQMKVTAPKNLVRNRKALPDTWEENIISSKLLSTDWTAGKPYEESVSVNGRPAFRFLIPEYYQPSCLVCHGKPKGEMDITGYPKEGGEEGELGAVISITLYR